MGSMQANEKISKGDRPPLLLSWSEIDQAIDLLEGELREQQFDVVVGVARAGLVPAVMLAHRFGIREFAVLEIRRTASDGVNSEKRPPVVTGSFNASAILRRRVLLVDDIVGEGLTMKVARDWVEERAVSVSTCCVVVNKANLPHTNIGLAVDHWGCLVHRWVRFPWERREWREEP